MAVERYAVSPTGRWGGKITGRPLPDAGDSLDGLSPEERTVMKNVWLSQAATERRVGHSFEVVHEALRELGSDAGLLEVSARAIDDEMRHAELCREMASLYAGRPCPRAAELPFTHPVHPAATSEALRRALYVVGQCAYNETFASAYLESALANATVPIARAALRELLSDEIDHARVGWAFVSTLSPQTRAELDSWLLLLAIANLREWRALQMPESSLALVGAHGVPAKASIEKALLEAIEGMMIPGFARFGFSVSGLERWFAQGAPTS